MPAQINSDDAYRRWVAAGRPDCWCGFKAVAIDHLQATRLYRQHFDQPPHTPQRRETP
jgi:hypothetical protein